MERGKFNLRRRGEVPEGPRPAGSFLSQQHQAGVRAGTRRTDANPEGCERTGAGSHGRSLDLKRSVYSYDTWLPGEGWGDGHGLNVADRPAIK